MNAILFLLASAVLGHWLAQLIPAPLRAEERLAIGLPIGLALTSLATLAAGWLVGFTAVTVATVAAAALLIAGLGWWRRPQSRTELRGELQDLRKRARTSGFWFGAFIFSSFATLLGLIFSTAMFSDNGALYAGFANIWGDWNQHLAQTTGFAYGQGFPPQLTTMSGQSLSYPFLTNFLSAIMIKGGLPLVSAMVLPVGLLAIAGLGLIMTLARQLAGTVAGWLAAPLFLLSGGLGFVNFLTDWWDSGWSLGDFLANQPHNYTQAGEGMLIANINFINTIYAYLVPQRAFTFGLPLVATVLLLLYLAVRHRRRGLFLAAGLVATLLPLVHSYGLLFLAIVTPIFALLSIRQLAGKRKLNWRSFTPWLYFVGPVVVLAGPQMLWLTQGVSAGEFFRFQFGWTAGDDNLLWFWLKNLWLFGPLVLLALWQLRRREPLLFALTAGAGVVFVAANLFVFQPWDWDNTKLFAYWYLASLPAVAAMLTWLAGKSAWRRIGVVVVGVTMLIAGAADVAKTLQPAKAKVEFFDRTGQEIGAAVRAETAPDAVFLTGQYPNNPFSGLGGRPIVLGYTGWLWSYGIAYEDRAADVKTMYEGGAGAEALLARHTVRYVVVGPAERGDRGLQLNEAFFRDRYAVWRQFGSVTVYDRAQSATASR